MNAPAPTPIRAEVNLKGTSWIWDIRRFTSYPEPHDNLLTFEKIRADKAPLLISFLAHPFPKVSMHSLRDKSCISFRKTVRCGRTPPSISMWYSREQILASRLTPLRTYYLKRNGMSHVPSIRVVHLKYIKVHDGRRLCEGDRKASR